MLGGVRDVLFKRQVITSVALKLPNRIQLPTLMCIIMLMSIQACRDARCNGLVFASEPRYLLFNRLSTYVRRLIFWSQFSSIASASGTNFRDVALAVDCFVNAVNRPFIDTPLSVHNAEGLYKDRKVC
jgi:hypothetical protein